MYFVHVRMCGRQSAAAMATSFVENGALHGTSVPARTIWLAG